MGVDRDEEQRWTAAKRDFVADHRDEVGDERDLIADDRDRLADDRERQADQREAEMDEREDRLEARERADGRDGSTAPPEARPGSSEERAARGEEARARAQAGRARADRSAQRGVADADRADATKRREAGSESRLAQEFARLAARLYETEDVDEVLDRVVLATVTALDGCDQASVTALEAAGYRTVASSAAAASAADVAQYETGEGPCLDAAGGGTTYAESFPDPRWPNLGDRLGDSGVGSALSNHVEAEGSGRQRGLVGSLNAYAGSPSAFDGEAQEIGVVLAAHASLAIRSVSQREALAELGDQLHAALGSRDVIGQAKGILMERYRLTPEQAFDALRRTSQRLNVRLAEVAQTLTETGEYDDDPLPGEPC